MATTADRKWAEALAEEIATKLRTKLRSRATVTVGFDKDADTHGVTVTIGRDEYQLLIPAPRAVYALFRNGKWLGGMNLSTDATPHQVAERLIDRIATTR